jgi:hypothetical protein
VNVCSARKLIQPADTTRAGQQNRNKACRPQRPRCAAYRIRRNSRTFSKEPRLSRDGVSTYLALTFGTLLSSQGTDASFVLTPAGFPPGFPSVLRFRLYQTLSCPIPGRRDFAFQFHALALPFPATPTLAEPFGPDSPSEGGCPPGPSAVPTSETLAESLPPNLIGVTSLRTWIPHFANVHTNKTTYVARSNGLAGWLPGTGRGRSSRRTARSTLRIRESSVNSAPG